MSSVHFGSIMKEFDDTDPTPELNLECIDSYSRKRIALLAAKVRELEARLAELESTDSSRRLNMATNDPEWY